MERYDTKEIKEAIRHLEAIILYPELKTALASLKTIRWIIEENPQHLLGFVTAKFRNFKEKK